MTFGFSKVVRAFNSVIGPAFKQSACTPTALIQTEHVKSRQLLQERLSLEHALRISPHASSCGGYGKTPATARHIKGSLKRGFRGGAKIGRLGGMQCSGDKAALFDWITVFLEIEISFLIFERALSSYALIGSYVF